MEKIFVRLSFFVCMLFLYAIAACPSDMWLESENRCVSLFSFNDTAFCDRLPLRDRFLTLNREVVLALGKNEFSSVFFGKDGYMFSNENVSCDTLSKNLAFAEKFGEEIEIDVCIIPQKVDALLTKLPRFYASGREELWHIAAENENNIPDVSPTLLLAANNSKYIYYRTDHHLTALGSYYVYKSLATTLGYKAHSAEDFSPQVVKSDFSGSDARKMLVKGNDKISLFRYKGDADFVTENCDKGTFYEGLYDYDKLMSHDAYGIYPIADCGRVKISAGEGKEKLLLICDSYGDSLAPFLARHFDLDIIDLRYFGGSVKELAEENNYTAALICFGMDTLAGKEILYKLKV